MSRLTASAASRGTIEDVDGGDPGLYPEIARPFERPPGPRTLAAFNRAAPRPHSPPARGHLARRWLMRDEWTMVIAVALEVSQGRRTG